MDPRAQVLSEYRKQLLLHREFEAKLKDSTFLKLCVCSSLWVFFFFYGSAIGGTKLGEAVQQVGGRPKGAAERGADHWRDSQAAGR